VRQFNLEEENNIPSWFQSTVLLGISLMLGVIAAAKRQQRDRFAFQWAGLAVLFAGLSLDESASLHEMTATQIRTLLHTSGLFYFAWVVPALLFLAVMAVTYWRFLMHLETHERRRFIASAVVYAGGAVGMEMLGGAYFSAHSNTADLTYIFMSGLEETLEMTGAILFTASLLDYLRTHLPEFGFRLATARFVDLP
jgi:hypothetical protein